MFGLVKQMKEKTITRLFGLIFVIVGLAHLSTLSVSPLPWIDEVAIIEMGRNGVLDRTPSWSMILPDEGRCFWTLYYVGGVAQEFAYRFFGGAFGPRALSLAGLCVASLLLVKVLKQKQVAPLMAYGVSLLYLVDPTITQSVRGARVDIWTTVCTFLSVLLVSRLGDDTKKDRSTFFCVGVLSITQLFIWVSSMLQLPIVVAEVIFLINRRKPNAGMIGSWFAFGALGALCALLLLGAPLLFHLDDVRQFFLVLAERNLTQNFTDNLVALKGCLLKTPVLSIMGGLFLPLFKKNWWLAFFFVLCLIFVFNTRLYVHRFVHLIPYFALALGQGLQQVNNVKRFIRKPVLCFLVLGMLGGFGYSVLLRNLSEFFLSGARRQQVLVDTLRKEVGSEGVRVYSDTFQTYYAGRELGWLQFRMAWGEWWLEGNAQKTMAAVDWFLTDGIPEDQQEALFKKGFKFVKTITVPSSANAKFVSAMRRLGRPIGYGPYQLYRRTDAQQTPSVPELGSNKDS